MADSPVSAFSMYRKNLKSPAKKISRPKKSRAKSTLSPASDDNNIRKPQRYEKTAVKRSKKNPKRKLEPHQHIAKNEAKSPKHKKDKQLLQNPITVKNGWSVDSPASPDSEHADESFASDNLADANSVPASHYSPIPATTFSPASPDHLEDRGLVPNTAGTRYSLASSEPNYGPVYSPPGFRQKSSSHAIENSYTKPRQAFEWIIAPVKPENFFKNKWEKAPLYIKRSIKQYYNQILTTEKLNTILRDNALFYTRNVDVVSYANGTRETHNPEGRAIPAALWDYYQNGCSIRILNPHTYCPKLHMLLAALQEYFGCMAGANVYLTPPHSQGFAPHYDDIEAFVLQLEGRKHWKLYAPLINSEVLPRVSSKNFDRSELKAPIKEVTLEAGDLLYFPRGTIHEGFTDEGAHSLHITVSVYQKTAYVDLLEQILKPALATAAQEDVEFRKGLPLQYLQHVGLANANGNSIQRKEIVAKLHELFSKMVQYIDIDAGADQLGKKFMWDSMPPFPSKHEKLHMVHENGEKMVNGQIFNKVGITLEVEIRLLRYHCIRIIEEQTDEELDESSSSFRVYYNTENAKYYHGEEQQFMVVSKSLAPAIKCLINIYPKFTKVETLPVDNDEDKMQIVADLWERGLLVTRKPLEY